MSGNSRHCAPVPSTHNTPFNTARVSCQGRPRRAPATAGRSTGSTSFHCSSVNSQRPVITVARRNQSNSRMNQIIAPGNYETGSRTEADAMWFLQKGESIDPALAEANNRCMAGYNKQTEKLKILPSPILPITYSLFATSQNLHPVLAHSQLALLLSRKGVSDDEPQRTPCRRAQRP